MHRIVDGTGALDATIQPKLELLALPDFRAKLMVYWSKQKTTTGDFISIPLPKDDRGRDI